MINNDAEKQQRTRLDFSSFELVREDTQMSEIGDLNKVIFYNKRGKIVPLQKIFVDYAIEQGNFPQSKVKFISMIGLALLLAPLGLQIVSFAMNLAYFSGMAGILICALMGAVNIFIYRTGKNPQNTNPRLQSIVSASLSMLCFVISGIIFSITKNKPCGNNGEQSCDTSSIATSVSGGFCLISFAYLMLSFGYINLITKMCRQSLDQLIYLRVLPFRIETTS